MSPYAGKFRIFYVLLVIFGGIGIGIGIYQLAKNEAPTVVTVQSPSISKAPLHWSDWKPEGTTTQKLRQIASHVQPEYHLDSGSQLVKVKASPLRFGKLPVTLAIAVATNPAQTLKGKGVFYRLCGTSDNCAIGEGKPSAARHRL